MKPRILIVDDHTIVLQGLAKLLEEQFEIAGVVTDGRAAVDQAGNLHPDVVVLDISMPLLNGIEVCRQIRRSTPAAKIVILTQQADKQYARAAFQAGASAYVVKQAAATELVLALQTALNGQYYVSNQMANESVRSRLRPDANPAELFGGELTPRQREVLQLVAEGKSAKDIAAILKVSTKTVEFHKSCIMQQLDMHSTAALTRYAIEQGMIPA